MTTRMTTQLGYCCVFSECIATLRASLAQQRAARREQQQAHSPVYKTHSTTANAVLDISMPSTEGSMPSACILRPSWWSGIPIFRNIS